MMRIPALLLGAGFACALQAQTPAAMSAPAPAAPCTQAEAHQFDFWIGEWDVAKPDGTPAGNSRIEAILGGCVIQENWTSAAPPYAGKSFNLFNQGSGLWEQFWVDNGGARLHLVGGMVADSMMMSGVQDAPNPKTHLIQRERITWTPQPDGSVRQWWETSNDDGKTWSTSFDGRYRRRAQGG